jgi:hypothetical protein
MAYRLAPNAPLAIVKDEVGRVHYHYRHNPLIPWIGEEQREHLLRNGIVEEIDVPPAAHSQGGVKPLAVSVEKPKKTAPIDEWVKFGVSKGNDELELRGLAKEELIDLLGDF